MPPIFALAASDDGLYLALGHEDGSVRIVSIADGALELVSRFDVPGAGRVRPVSLAWASSKALVVGCSNSQLVRAELQGAIWRVTQRMPVDKARGEQTVVWACTVLRDGTVVSGDSRGMLSFFEPRLGTQVASVRAHKADILAVAVNDDAIYSSGIDQRTCETRRTGASWVLSNARRMHSHDVRALIVSRPSLDNAPVLTSAGIDAALVVVPIASTPARNPVSESKSTSFEDATHRRLVHVPQRAPPVCIAREARLLVLRRARSIAIWRVKAGAPEDHDDEDGWRKHASLLGNAPKNSEDGFEKLVEMELMLQTSLVTSAISDDGRWLLASDLFEAKLFKLSADGTPRRQPAFTTTLATALAGAGIGTGVSRAHFVTQTRLALATALAPSRIVVVDLGADFNVVSVLNSAKSAPRQLASNGRVAADDSDEEEVQTEERPAADVVAMASRGNMLATADAERNVCVYDLKRNVLAAVLPTVPSVPTALAFASDSLLMVAFPSNAFAVYDLEARKFPDWSAPMSSLATNALMDNRDPVIGLASVEDGVLAWAANWVAKVDVEAMRDAAPRTKKRSRRRANTERASKAVAEDPSLYDGAQMSFTATRRLHPLIGFGLIGDNELLAVEKPWFDIVGSLPEPWLANSAYGM